MVFNITMSTIFEYNDTSFKNFSKFYDKAPKRARKATARMLSKFAFGVRNQAIKEIKETMNVRNARFVERQMRFKSAKPINIDSQESGAGSVSVRGFSGWEENAKGSRDPRTRTQSLLARGNSWGKKVRPSVRMKPANEFTSEGDFKLPDGKRKMPAYFAKIRTKRKNKPFIIKKKYKSMPKGLYVFKRGKIMKLQNLDPKPKSIRKNPWLRTARRKFFSKNSIEDLWKESMEDMFKLKNF